MNLRFLVLSVWLRSQLQFLDRLNVLLQQTNRNRLRILSMSLSTLTCVLTLSSPAISRPYNSSLRLPVETARVQSSGNWSWQDNATVHPLVARMPANIETSIQSVAQYIIKNESDPFQQAKALHDYVATRIDYDYAAYKRGYYPPQDARTVFRTRKGVCSGYARLLQALGNAAGIEVAYIPGDFRNSSEGLSGEGHAWNAMKINQKWYLVDATWNSGTLTNSGFTKQYNTSYLFPPAEVMGLTHFPNDPNWQLVSRPLSRPEFIRQPFLQPKFFAEGLKLISPKGSNFKVWNNLTIELENPKKRWILTQVISPDGQSSLCAQPTRDTKRISCNLPGKGTHEVRLFSSTQPYSQYQYVGAFKFTK